MEFNDLDNFFNKMVEYYNLEKEEEPLTLFPNYATYKDRQVKNQKHDKKRKGGLTQRKLNEFDFSDLEKMFYGSYFMKNINAMSNIIPKIIRYESYNDILAFSFGLGKIRNVSEYKAIRDFTIKRIADSKYSALAYTLFRYVMEKGYGNNKIKNHIAGKEERNYYKKLFKDTEKANSFIKSFLSAKIPVNYTEIDTFSGLMISDGLMKDDVYDPNMDGEDKGLYITEIVKNVNKIYNVNKK